MDQRGSLSKSLEDLVSKSQITPGNKKHIEQKAGRIFHHWYELRRGAATAPQGPPSQGVQRAAVPMPGPVIDIATIQRVATQHHFVWFYKAPENTLTQCFGNYFEGGTRVLGCRTSEGAFLAQKYGYELDASHPFTDLVGDALHRENKKHAAAGRTVSGWADGGNIAAMRAVIAAKFAPGTPLAEALLATKDAYLVEHNPVKGRDAIWSDDNDGSGRNMLGILLMERREALGGAGIVLPPQKYLQNPEGLH
jgi:predicted NAD-dependent protein-ADP-ribosyltransferase YbiA (DUF1768 family)